MNTFLLENVVPSVSTEEFTNKLNISWGQIDTLLDGISGTFIILCLGITILACIVSAVFNLKVASRFCSAMGCIIFGIFLFKYRTIIVGWLFNIFSSGAGIAIPWF